MERGQASAALIVGERVALAERKDGQTGEQCQRALLAGRRHQSPIER
jgi:hypothetical protein